jgi:hypothetical protein
VAATRRPHTVRGRRISSSASQLGSQRYPANTGAEPSNGPHNGFGRIDETAFPPVATDNSVCVHRLRLPPISDSLLSWLPATRFALHRLRLAPIFAHLLSWLPSSRRCSIRSGVWPGHEPRCTWKSSPFVTNCRSSTDRAGRFIGSIRRECLDHMIILSIAGLQRVLADYVAYYMNTRTHLSLGKDAPASRPVTPPSAGRIVESPQVHGLHHRYDRAAAQQRLPLALSFLGHWGSRRDCSQVHTDGDAPRRSDASGSPRRPRHL